MSRAILDQILLTSEEQTGEKQKRHLENLAGQMVAIRVTAPLLGYILQLNKKKRILHSDSDPTVKYSPRNNLSSAEFQLLHVHYSYNDLHINWKEVLVRSLAKYPCT